MRGSTINYKYMTDISSKLDVTLPQALADSHAALVERRAKHLEYLDRAGEGESVKDAILDALEAGRAPTSDKRVQAAITREAVSKLNLESIVQQKHTVAVNELVKQHLPGMVGLWAEASRVHVQMMVESFAILGDVALHDASAAARNVKQGEARARAEYANARVIAATEAIHRAFTDMKIAMSGNEGQILLLCPDITLDDARAIADPNTPTTPWSLIRGAHRIELPTVEEWRARRATKIADREVATKERNARHFKYGYMGAHREVVAS